MNKKFIEGKEYKLRSDYPEYDGYNRDIVFEGRKTGFVSQKLPVLTDRKLRKVIRCHICDTNRNTWSVCFEGINGGNWTYYPEDFEIGVIDDWQGEFE